MTDLEKIYIDLYHKVAKTEKVAEVTKTAMNPWTKALALGVLGLGAGGLGYLGGQATGDSSNEGMAQQLGANAAQEEGYGYDPYAEQYDPYADQSGGDQNFYDYSADPYGGYY